MRRVARAAELLWLVLLAACSLVPSPMVPGKPVGPAGAPQVAEVLGQPVRATSAAEMQHLILRELTDRYAAERGIAVTPAEIDAYVTDLRRTVPAAPSRGAASADNAETRAVYEQVAQAFILQRKIDGALYRQYGGRVALRSGGAVPVDAYRRFLEDQVAQQRFRIIDPAYEREFWRIWSDDSRYLYEPEGSEAAARAFDPPVAARP